MQKRVKTYLSVFLLFLFLFPMAEKQVHAFNHHTDEHCSSSDKHFHEEEHSCNICDFNFTDSALCPEDEISFSLAVISSDYNTYSENNYSEKAFYLLSSRGPPRA
ncbi:MAG: hypothetical protein K0Q95_35 [Bacteroidota bacterium]|jgi:hypothetical protein|nr:hypothetical protein [Bacteroidota bacterium]